MREAWNIRFGTAGTSDSFAAQGYKSSLDVPEYTAQMGLNAFEYQCGRGVRLGLDKAARMAALAAERDILFSVHAPYYISMSSLEEDKRLNSIQYLLFHFVVSFSFWCVVFVVSFCVLCVYCVYCVFVCFFLSS